MPSRRAVSHERTSLLQAAAARLRGLAGGRRRARHAEILWRAVADNHHDPVIAFDALLAPRHCSPAARSLVGDDVFAAIHPDDRAALRAALQSGVPQDVICRVLRPGGSEAGIEACCRPVGTDGGAVVMLRDTAREHGLHLRLKDALGRLARLSQHDSLTGLANRASFLQQVDRATGLTAVVLIDLDRFKPINDMHGHPTGDAVLQETALRLRRALGEAVPLARLGADEFAALLPASDGDLSIAARVRDVIRVIEEPIRVGVTIVDVGAAIGIAVSGRDGTDSASLLRSADIAMAHVKNAGGSSYRFFEKRMGDLLAEACALKSDLRSAIATGEVLPYFQPLVSIPTGEIDGFEVLARWQHPKRGLLLPMTFLPLVEECGLSLTLFAALLRSACLAARDWGDRVRLTVNLSPHELKQEDLPELISRVLEETGFAGTRLEIEITENALVEDSRIARGVLERIRALGVTVALDDFGTGFSSLYHLRVLPFDKVKIDKSFIKGLATDPDDDRYVSAIIGLCRSLGLAMTAEGIENDMTARRLGELGCVYGQGYLYGRPAPAVDTARLLSRSGISVAAE